MSRFETLKSNESKVVPYVYNPVNVWISKGSTDGRDGKNWSNGDILETDELTFNESSSIDCIFSCDIKCEDLAIKSTYGGTVICNGILNLLRTRAKYRMVNLSYAQGSGLVLTSNAFVTSNANDFYSSLNSSSSTWTTSGTWST